MQLNKEIAMKIINEVKPLTKENIIIVNDKSIIVASSDNSRINEYHEGAEIVIKSKEKLYIDSESSENLKGVRPGINLPIILKERIIGVIGITGLPNKIEPFADLLRKMTELIVREVYYQEKKEWETRGLESFIYDWVYSEKINDTLLSKGETYNINFNTPYLCAIIEFNQSDSYDQVLRNQKILESWYIQYFPKNKKDFFIPWGFGRYLLILEHENHYRKAQLKETFEKWREELKINNDIILNIGVGRTIEKKYIKKTYYEAFKALKVSNKKNQIIFYENLLLDILTEELPQEIKNEYVNRVIKTIENNEELIITIKTYLNEDQSMKKTALKLHIHLNTLNYRLNKVYEITGINPKEAEGVTIFYLAIYLLDSIKVVKS